MKAGELKQSVTIFMYELCTDMFFFFYPIYEVSIFVCKLIEYIL